MKKIALEEHFATEELWPYIERYNKSTKNDAMFAEFRRRLCDFEALRLEAMDEAGIDIAVLSPTVPGVQAEPDEGKAIDLARRVNDALAEQIRKRPDRYAGFASLPLQSPTAAATELRRAIRDLGFTGAMVNGHTLGRYLDDESFAPVWAESEQLGVPIYLHPTNPVDAPAMFAGRPEIHGATWAWTAEAASHALRMVFGGTFQRHPRAQLILGHMGETLPFLLWRLDSRAELRAGGKLPEGQWPSQILRKHLWVTTSGVCDHAALELTLRNLGTDRVMFSVDYPYESSRVAADFLESAPIDSESRAKIAFDNAARLLQLQ